MILFFPLLHQFLKHYQRQTNSSQTARPEIPPSFEDNDWSSAAGASNAWEV